MKLIRMAAVASVAALLAAPVLAQDDPTPPQSAEGAQQPDQDTPPLPDTEAADAPATDAAPAQDAAPAPAPPDSAPPAADTTTSQMYPAPPPTPAAAPGSDASTWKAGDPGITSNQPVPNPPEKPKRKPHR